MGSVRKALSRSGGIYNTAFARASTLKSPGLLDFSSTNSITGLNTFSTSTSNQRRYGLYRGWYYSGVHAICTKAAGQPFKVGKILKKTEGDKNRPGTLKAWQRLKMTESMQQKSAEEEIDLMLDHPLIKSVEKPNNIQYRWQFVYSFIANLHLTGWAFVVGNVTEEGKFEFFSVPTTWVHPNHTEGPFSKFKIFNPKDPNGQANAMELDRNQVAFAYLPDPSDPMKALAPAQAQMAAIEIDENMQTSQRVFFDNGVFPSVIISVGKDPHPEVPGGIRPRLSGPQRRQIYGMIRKVMQGVSNYGNPAIVDGLIEKIERLSATQNEMGWEKTEDKIRARILSSIGVHPFILGEEMAGSYAQAYEVKNIFFSRVNTFLDMIGIVIVDLYQGLTEDNSDDLIAWWEQCRARDPQMERLMLEKARERQDVTKNEFRAFVGFPPDRDGNEVHIHRQSLKDIELIAEKINTGLLSEEQGKAILMAHGMPDDVAAEIAKKSEAPPPPSPMPFGGGAPLQQLEEEEPEEEMDAEEALNKAISVLERLVT